MTLLSSSVTQSAATTDALPAAGVVAESGMLWNGATFDRMRGALGVEYVTAGGSTTGVVAAGAVTTVVKASAGRLCRVVVTGAAPTAALTFYDNATTSTGTVLGVVPTSAVTGSIYDLQLPAVNGITAGGAAGSAAVTVSYY